MSNMARTLNMIRYGTDASLPARRDLRAGPITLVLEGGDLRYVGLGNTEIVRRLYVAIRDRNWGTIPPHYTRFDLADHGDHFRIDLAAEHVSDDVDFAWSGVIEGRPDGTITYSLDGAPRKAFMRNRIGFCVLHPSELAGLPASTQTPDGVVDHAFPDFISPHQPFIDMISISHPAGPDAFATISFEGDLFEMEDQRNWTDASFKTYGTPLRLPYPVEVGPDDHISQRVTISVSGAPSTEGHKSHSNRPDLAVEIDSLAPLPAIGFGAGLGGTISPEDMTRLRSLAPGHLWVSVDLSSDNWRDVLAEATDRAIALQTTLDLSVAAAPEGGWDTLTAALTHMSSPVGRVFAFPVTDEPIVFPRSDLATHPETIAAARNAFSAAGIDAKLGGGTRAYFTELNRASDFLPVDDLDSVTYTINPQVHASDTLSVIETLLVQGDTIRSARNLIGDRELTVGPVTLQPPFNPNATGPAPATPDDQLPPTVDARQLSLFGAGWTLGSISELSRAGADAMTFYELYGWRGLSERRRDLTRRALFPSDPGQLFPLYHIFAAASDFAGGSIASVTVAEPFTLAALALRSDNRLRILIASLVDERSTVAVQIPGLQDASVTNLDETTWDEAAFDPGFLRRASGAALTIEHGSTTFEMLPFAVACIDGHAG